MMGSLANHHSSQFTKLLLLGDAKSGKTTSLESLVADGWKLRILDMDNLLDGLRDKVLRDCPQRIDNVEYRTLRDKYKTGPLGPMLDGKPTAFIKAMEILDRWKYDDVDLGKPKEWGPNAILVVDSLSRLCDAAHAFHIAISGPKADGRAVYWASQKAVEMFLANVTSEGFGTNVIITCHGIYRDLPDGTTKIFPIGLGDKLSPKIPTYFPVYIRYKHSAGKRVVQIESDVMIDLAMPKLGAFEGKTLPIETGLATIFKILHAETAPTQERPKAVTLRRRF